VKREKIDEEVEKIRQIAWTTNTSEKFEWQLR